MKKAVSKDAGHSNKNDLGDNSNYRVDYDGISDDDWMDEYVVEEYFSKRKSRIRKQRKRVSKNYNKYDEEW